MNLLLVMVLFLLSILFVFEMKRSLNRSSVTNKLINEYALPRSTTTVPVTES